MKTPVVKVERGVSEQCVYAGGGGGTKGGAAKVPVVKVEGESRQALNGEDSGSANLIDDDLCVGDSPFPHVPMIWDRDKQGWVPASKKDVRES